MKFVKGMAAGMVVGAGLMLAFGPDRRTSRRQFNRAMRSMRGAMEEIGSALGI